MDRINTKIADIAADMAGVSEESRRVETFTQLISGTVLLITDGVDDWLGMSKAQTKEYNKQLSLLKQQEESQKNIRLTRGGVGLDLESEYFDSKMDKTSEITDYELEQAIRLNDGLQLLRQERIAREEVYRQNRIKADYNQMASEIDAWADKNQKLNDLDAQRDLMARKWRQKDLDDERAASAMKVQIAMGVGGQLANAFGQLASMQNTQSKEGFENYKKMATAQATVSTSLAVMQAWASLPPPFNAIAAGLATSVGALQVAQIQSQEFTPTQTTALRKRWRCR